LANAVVTKAGSRRRHGGWGTSAAGYIPTGLRRSGPTSRVLRATEKRQNSTAAEK